MGGGYPAPTTPTRRRWGDPIIVAIFPLLKWIVAGALPNFSRYTIAKIFYLEIMCMYGIPHCVIMDRGFEFGGLFQDYCRELGSGPGKAVQKCAESNNMVLYHC